MEFFLLKTKSKKTFLGRISVLEFSTRENYQSALRKFEKFCIEYYEERKIDEIVTELKSLKSESQDEAYCGVLQDFVNWLTKKHLSIVKASNI